MAILAQTMTVRHLFLLACATYLGCVVEGRLFTIFYVLVGLVYIFSIINNFAQSIIKAAEEKALEKLDDDPTDDKVGFVFI